MFSPDRILTIRKSRGYSQEMLAEHSGVSLRTIQRVEQGDTVPRGHTLQALAAALGVALDDFRAAPGLPAPEPLPPVEDRAPFAPEPAAGAAAVSAPAHLPALRPAAEVAPRHPLPTASPALRADPQFLQLLNLSALSFLVLPLLNIVVPLWLWRSRRHQVEHAAEVGRRVLGFQILWQAGSTVAYLLLVLSYWLAARFYHVKGPDLFVGVFIVSYLLNVLTVAYYARRLRQGRLDIYPVRL